MSNFRTFQNQWEPCSVHSVDVASYSVSLSDNIKILGVTLDCHLFLDKHISSICKSAYYHIQSLRHIRSAITDDMAKSIASSLVCSRLDYANSLLLGTTQKNIKRLQRVQNTLARVVASHALAHCTCSFDILQDLHWLPIDQHIEFKLATLTYYILNSSQPVYLHSLLNYHTPTRSLHSANTNLLSVPRVCTTFASCGFSTAAPTVWNSLPSSIRSSTSTDTFRCLLKTHCFQQAYCSS